LLPLYEALRPCRSDYQIAAVENGFPHVSLLACRVDQPGFANALVPFQIAGPLETHQLEDFLHCTKFYSGVYNERHTETFHMGRNFPFVSDFVA